MNGAACFFVVLAVFFQFLAMCFIGFRCREWHGRTRVQQETSYKYWYWFWFFVLLVGVLLGNIAYELVLGVGTNELNARYESSWTALTRQGSPMLYLACGISVVGSVFIVAAVFAILSYGIEEFIRCYRQVDGCQWGVLWVLQVSSAIPLFYFLCGKANLNFPSASDWLTAIWGTDFTTTFLAMLSTSIGSTHIVFGYFRNYRKSWRQREILLGNYKSIVKSIETETTERRIQFQELVQLVSTQTKVIQFALDEQKKQLTAQQIKERDEASTKLKASELDAAKKIAAIEAAQLKAKTDAITPGGTTGEDVVAPIAGGVLLGFAVGGPVGAVIGGALGWLGNKLK